MLEYELTIRDYWQVILKRRFTLCLMFFAVLIPVAIHTNMQKPVYRATASVQWIERRPFAKALIDLVYTPTTTGDPLITQSRIITSLAVIERAARELGLVDEQATAIEIMRQAANIRGAVSTSIATGTNMIYINVTHENPQLAADIANKVAEVYIAENLREKSKQTRSVREFIEKQLEEVTVKLEKSEDTLARFKEIEVPSGVALPLQGRLADLEAKRQSILRLYTERHPDVKNIDEEITQVKEKLKALPQKELEYIRLNRDVEINTGLFRQFKTKLEAARIAEAEKIEDVSLVDQAVAPLSPIRPNKRLNYMVGAMMGLVLGLVATSIIEQLDTSIAKIEDVEAYLRLPVLGVIPYSSIEREKKLTPDFLKQKDKINEIKKHLIIYPSVSSTIAEAYNILDTNIWLSFQQKSFPKVIIISSTLPGEGKTLISVNLAITMAQRGMRVILIDADLRKPLLYRLFNLKREPGLSDILSNTCKVKDALRNLSDLFLSLKQENAHYLKTSGINNLQFITPGHLPDNPAVLFGSTNTAALIEELKKDFEVILFDTPPALPVSDVSILASQADALILVYRVGKTPRNALNRAKKQLESSGAKLKGVVLNCLKPQTEMVKSYYYHYYRYYGKDKKEESSV